MIFDSAKMIDVMSFEGVQVWEILFLIKETGYNYFSSTG
jgi:hypothetical protein